MINTVAAAAKLNLQTRHFGRMPGWPFKPTNGGYDTLECGERLNILPRA